MAIVVTHPSIFAYSTEKEPKANKFVAISIAFHILFACGFYLVHTDKTLMDLLMSGETLAVAADDTPVVQEIDLEEIPPPPVVETPEFEKPEDVVEKKPEPPKPKPIPVVSPKPTSVVQAPVYAASKPIPGNSDFPKPAYPYEARKRRQQGTVTLMISYDSSGSVTDAVVTSSSGVGILDSGARDWVRKHWNFAHAAPGRSGSAEVPLRFELATN
jgi:protein TonB